MDKETLHLWCAYPDDLLDEEAARACFRILSDDERDRLQRFKFDRHRREYLATHALARTALSHHRPHPPATWRFAVNEYGKPAIDPSCGLHFNLSNSLGLVVCLIAEGADVGIDVESEARAATIIEVAPTVFSPLEQAQLNALPEAAKPDRALRLWTLKEAYIKARGMGLALPLDKFSFAFPESGGIRLEIDPALHDQPDRWRFCVLEHTGHRIALMVEANPAANLQIWESRPPMTAPHRIELGGQTWYSGL